MKVYIDGDGCPVVKITVETAKKYGLDVTIVCDTAHEFSYDGVEVVTVGKGADSADLRLVNMLSKGDIAITQDYGLAALCLSRGAFAIEQNGMVYTNDNIDGLLLSRQTAQKLRNSGKRLKGPRKRTKDDDARFLAALERLIQEQLQHKGG